MRCLYTVILVSLLTIPRIAGQEVVVTAKFDTTRILIGDQIYFHFSVEKPSGLDVIIPQFSDTLVKNIDILSGPATDTTLLNDDRIKITDRYLITSFYAGQYQISPLFVEVKSENIVRRYFSDYTRLEVLRVNIAPADTTAKIFDIVDPYRAPVTAGEILPWALIGLAGALILYFLYRFLRKLKINKSPREEVISTDPAHVIAFRELEKLRDEELWQKGETKKYYTILTEIVRLYLENRYRVYSLEMTTEETLDALRKTGFPKNESFGRLESVLKGADLVKFAKYKPLPDENEACWENSWTFVSETMEKEQPAEYQEKGKEVVR